MAHGITIQEAATTVLPARRAPYVPVVVGTAPVHRGSQAATPLEPVIAYTFDEAVAKLGYSDDWARYTLCEAMTALFRLYGQGPVVLINVLSPSAVGTEATATKALVGGTLTIAADAVLSSLVVKNQGGTTTYTKGTDYTAAYDTAGQIVVTRIASGTIASATDTLSLTYDIIPDPTTITSTDIIGGTDAESGVRTGLDLVDEVYPRWRMAPGMILAPGWSHLPAVEAIMVAKALNVSGVFRCIAIADIDVSAAATYDAVSAWKQTNGYDHPHLVACWPFVQQGGLTYHLSSHVAAGLLRTDGQYGDIPFVSPSNKAATITGIVNAAGTPVYLSRAQANALESVGVITALNWEQWVFWGNRTSHYPTSTDPKDTFIPTRRLFDFVGNQLLLMIWQRLDFPLNKRTIQDVVDAGNQYLNALVGAGALYGGRVEFLADDNPVVSVMDGQAVFRVSLASPSPMQDITLLLQYDAQYVTVVYAE